MTKKFKYIFSCQRVKIERRNRKGKQRKPSNYSTFSDYHVAFIYNIFDQLHSDKFF